jgi:hypothetical protein
VLVVTGLFDAPSGHELDGCAQTLELIADTDDLFGELAREVQRFEHDRKGPDSVTGTVEFLDPRSGVGHNHETDRIDRL